MVTPKSRSSLSPITGARSLRPIEKPSVTALVAERIRAAIHFGYFLPGDKLPSERDISEILGVSRVSVNQAIKILREDGYLVSRRGPTGAATVTPLTKPLKKQREALSKNKAQFHQLMEFRTENEAVAAFTAAQRRTKTDLQAIGAAVDAMVGCEDLAQFRRFDLEFHLAVARASKNPYIEHVVQLARDHMFLLIGHIDELILSTTLNAHDRVYRAIRDGDAERAETAMREHLFESENELAPDLP